MIADPYDVPLQDTALRDELELTTLLIIAANESQALPQSRIDAILGLEHQTTVGGSREHVGSVRQSLAPTMTALVPVV